MVAWKWGRGVSMPARSDPLLQPKGLETREGKQEKDRCWRKRQQEAVTRKMGLLARVCRRQEFQAGSRRCGIGSWLRRRVTGGRRR